METGATRKTGITRHRLFSAGLCAAICLLAASCSSAPIRPTGTPSYGPAEPTTQAPSPEPSPVAETPAETAPPPAYGPDPFQVRPVVLVLGPGLARGFAYAGAIRALADAKIPIGAIVGTEIGALIGALYAMDGSINTLEWDLMKFKETTFPRKADRFSKLLGKEISDGKQLEQTLTEVFKKRDLGDSKIPVNIVLLDEGSGETLFVSRGNAGQALRAALAVPGAIEPGPWENGSATSASAKLPYAISQARALGLGPVVVIDVIHQAPASSPQASQVEKKIIEDLSSSARQTPREFEGADLVIRPKLVDIGFLDYQKRTQAIFQGRIAIRAEISAIRHLVGLPQE